LFRQKLAVPPDQVAVEIDFATAVIAPLDADQIPVNLAAVSVIGFFISLTRGEME
jgi:hypothetical protein